MSILKNQILEEELLHLVTTNQFTLLFHYNTIKSKEWLHLQKLLFQKQLNTPHKVIPVRYFSKLLQNRGISRASPPTRPPQGKTATTSDLAVLSVWPKANMNLPDTACFVKKFESLGGSFCFFFCSDKSKVIDLSLLFSSKGGAVGIESGFAPSNYLPQFLNLGMIQTTPSMDKEILFENTFFSSYAIEKFLKLDTSIYSELYHSLIQNGQLISNLNFSMELSCGNLSPLKQNQLNLLFLLKKSQRTKPQLV